MMVLRLQEVSNLFPRLTYNYHRLIDASQMKDGELPASEMCALEEGEEEDEVKICQ